MNRIIIQKRVQHFEARLHRNVGPPLIGGGNTMIEAIGSLVVQSPEEFGLHAIAYNNDVATKDYLLQHDLSSTIYKRES